MLYSIHGGLSKHRNGNVPIDVPGNSKPEACLVTNNTFPLNCIKCVTGADASVVSLLNNGCPGVVQPIRFRRPVAAMNESEDGKDGHKQLECPRAVPHLDPQDVLARIPWSPCPNLSRVEAQRWRGSGLTLQSLSLTGPSNGNLVLS